MRRAVAHAPAQPRDHPAHECTPEGVLLLRGVRPKGRTRVGPRGGSLWRLGYHRELVAVLAAEAVQPVGRRLSPQSGGRLRGLDAGVLGRGSLFYVPVVVQAQPTRAEGSLPQDRLPLPPYALDPVWIRTRTRLLSGTGLCPRGSNGHGLLLFDVGVLMYLPRELPRRVHHGRQVHRLTDDVRELRGDSGDEIWIAGFLLHSDLSRLALERVVVPAFLRLALLIDEVAGVRVTAAAHGRGAAGVQRGGRLGRGGGERGVRSLPFVSEHPESGVVSAQRAEDGRADAGVLDGVADELLVRGVLGLVQDDARDREFVVEGEVAFEERSGGSRGEPVAVEDEDDGRAEPLGELSGAALLIAEGSVVEPVAALDDGDVRVPREPLRDGQVVLLREHPPVEVVAGLAGGGLVQERVQEVGSHLEALDAQAALAEGRHQADRDGGLAHARLHTPDHDDLAASHLAFNSFLRVRLLSVRHLGLDRYFGAVRASARWSVVLNGDPSVALV
mmetsp:Transcript_8788/g.39994  ORF Transcript_8788/g.39994 Transcript_8788/m.39994 type:complete len:502 (+) Transcript_8788:4644-6149(+)